MENNTFETLYEKTKEHLENKRYAFKPKIPRRHRFDDKGGMFKKGDIIYKSNGEIDYDTTVQPTPHKIVMLSMAFNMAYENYRAIRGERKAVKKIESLGDMSDMLLRYFGNKYYKNIDNVAVENSLIDINQNYQFEEIERFADIEYKLYGVVQRLRNYHSHYIHEPGILTFDDFFYHDKQNVLTSEEFKEAKKWFYTRFTDVHNHLLQSLQNRKKLLIESEDTYLDKSKASSIDKVLESMQKIHFFERDGETISLDGQLFIATMFMYKRQAKTILDKWRNVKEPEGYENSKQTLFLYYSLREKYSVNNYNDNLLKFRDITSKLSTIPYHTNSNLEFIYKKINEINEENYRKIESIEKNNSRNKGKVERKPENKNGKLLAQKKTEQKNLIDILKTVNKGKFRKQLKKVELEIAELSNLQPASELSELDKVKNKIMPIRKRHIFTGVLLQYILDNNLITNNNFKIAVQKNASDTIRYYEKHKDVLDINKNVTFLKDQIKKLPKNSKERIVLNEHLKELKRNFMFLSPEELHSRRSVTKLKDNEGEETSIEGDDYRFTLKKGNALFQYRYETNKIANITISSQLLMKWVFIHLTEGNNEGFNKIDKYIQSHIKQLTKPGMTSEKLVANFKKNPQNVHLIGECSKEYPKVYPRSIIKNATQAETITFDDVRVTLKNRVNRLERFYRSNQLQAKPWKYAAKEKIDYILEYMHVRLVHEVYKNKINQDVDTETFIRHNYFNMTTNHFAREYFRFFGRYKNNNLSEDQKEVTLKVVNQLKTDYPICFGFVNSDINDSNSLEEVYNSILLNYIHFLEKVVKNIEEYTNEQLIKIFKISTTSNTAHVDGMLDSFYVRSFALSNDVIDIKTILSEKWEDFKTEREKKLNGKPFYCSDYTFIREKLQEDKVKTNIDYILQHILPLSKIDKIPSKVFRLLLSMKSEELMLWSIAKHYWQKADNYGKPYEMTAQEQDATSSSYQEYCTFNKVYRKDLDYTITVDAKFWNDRNQKRFPAVYDENRDWAADPLKIKLKVPARKYDNKMLGAETELIKEFCLWNCYNPTTKVIELIVDYKHTNKNNNVTTIYNLNNYEELLKVIHKKLKESISDITLILGAEKRIIDKNLTKYLKLIKEKYENDTAIEDFYLAFTNKEGEFPKDVVLFKEFMGESVKGHFGNTETIKGYLIMFRNFALHYQLQDPKRKQIITKFLNDVFDIKKAKAKEYHEYERTNYLD